MRPRIRDSGCVRPWCHLVVHHAFTPHPLSLQLTMAALFFLLGVVALILGFGSPPLASGWRPIVYVSAYLFALSGVLVFAHLNSINFTGGWR